MDSLEQLNSRFGIAESLRFEAGGGGLTRAVISTPQAVSQVYLHGAHVTAYQPLGRDSLLFLSSRSEFTRTKSIRGGIPICFPWFSAGKNDATTPAHGFARTSEWMVESSGTEKDGIRLVLSLTGDDRTRATWPYDFLARYSVTVGAKLQVALEVTNTGSSAFEFEEAFHTYLRVGDVRQVSVEGLGGTEYLDKVQGMKRVVQEPAIVKFTSETDRVYLKTRATCVARDPVGGKNIVVAKKNSDTTVVWNPWEMKAGELSDMGKGEWANMLCIETCNAKDAAITLLPGKSHTMTAIMSLETGV